MNPDATNDIPLGYNCEPMTDRHPPTKNPTPWSRFHVQNAYVPAYSGSGGIATTGHDMMRWLQFCMGALPSTSMSWDDSLLLSSTLEHTQSPMSGLTTRESDLVCRGWFVRPASASGEARTWKAGEIGGTSTFITVTSGPATDSVSSAGTLVMLNASGLTARDGRGDQVDLVPDMANTFMDYLQNGWPCSA